MGGRKGLIALTDTTIVSKRCPICDRPAAERYRPFCSKRCADIDLNRWFTGVYSVPAAPDEEAESPEDGSQA